VLAFSSIGADPTRPPAPEFVGTATDEARPALFIRDASRSWVQVPDLFATLAAAIDQMRARHPITRIAAIGQSMGGVAALSAAACLPIDLVLAFGPQSFITPPATRWRDWTACLAPLAPLTTGQARIVLLHGLVDDHAQAMDFAQVPGADHILFPTLTHSALCPQLKALGALNGLLASAIVGDRRRMLRIAASAGGRAVALQDERSGAAIGRVGKGADQERHMIMPLRIRHAKADRDLIEKQQGPRRLTGVAQIIARPKHQLILPHLQRLSREQWRIRAAIAIGHHLFQERMPIWADPVEHDLHTLRWLAPGRVQYMGAQPSARHLHLLALRAAPSRRPGSPPQSSPNRA
jgi:hypothetical protein